MVILPSAQSLRNSSIFLQSVIKIRLPYVQTCAAVHLVGHNKANIPECRLYNHGHLSAKQLVCHQVTRNLTFASKRYLPTPFKTRSLLSAHTSSDLSSQHRNFSSFKDIFRQNTTVYAAEPLVADTSAVSSTAPVTPPATNLTDGVEYIPLPPVPPIGGLDPATLTALGEPSLSSLGLTGWSPVGVITQGLELLHVHCGLPWWGSIVVATLIVRAALFPLVVVTQRNSAKLANVSPQMEALQLKITDARQSGDQMQVSRYTHELMEFMKEKNVNPIKSMMVPLVQAPVFISMFIGLRRCANLPVMSMTTGGVLWLTDLTVADPYYLLPLMTCCTLYATVALSTDLGKLQMSSDNARIMSTMFRFFPVISFPFMINFPGTVLCYWLTTNLVSLGQTGFLRIPRVREALNIPKQVKHDINSLPESKQQSKKSILEAAKDSWRNMQVTRELQDRQRYDEVRFAKAGTGPIVRTFKHDPTKPKKGTKPPAVSVKAKLKQ